MVVMARSLSLHSAHPRILAGGGLAEPAATSFPDVRRSKTDHAQRPKTRIDPAPAFHKDEEDRIQTEQYKSAQILMRPVERRVCDRL